MDALPGFVTSAVIVLGWVLLHFLWQGAVIGLVYGAIRRHLPSGGPRYALGLVAFAALALCPLVTTLWLLADPASSVQPLPIAAPTPTAAITGVAAITPSLDLEMLLPWLVALWGVGVLLLTTRALLHWHSLSRLIRGGLPLPEWQGRLADLLVAFGIRRPVRLLWSAQVQTPTLVGWFKPVILLPAAVALGFPAAQIELILAHELGHLRRFDHVVNLVQVVVETMLFYHPIVHWVSRDLRHEREICCDELVLQLRDSDAREYARTLADLEGLRLDSTAVLALPATGGLLLERVQRIAGVPPVVLRSRAPGRLLPLLISAAALVCIAAAQRVQLDRSDLIAALTLREFNALLSVPTPKVERTALAVADLRVTRERLTLATPVALERVEPERVVNYEPPSFGMTSDAVAPPSAPPVVDALDVGNLAFNAPVSLPIEAAPAVPASEPVSVRHEPMPLRMTQPVYPEQALERGTEGQVILAFGLDASGAVRDINVVAAKPARVFESAAVNALRRWRFDPATVGTVGARYSRTFVFSLGGAESVDALEELQALPECRAVTGTRICRRAGEVGATDVETLQTR